MSIRQTSFSDLGTPLHDVPFCVLDLETTGGSAATCEITEIGAVRFIQGEEVGRFQTLVNPGVEIPPTITILTGITHFMVVDAPRIEEALPSLLEFIGDAVIVGHNVRFDMSFLNAAAERLGYGRLPNPTSDTHALARRLVRDETRNLKLSSLAVHFRSPVTPTHRALDDARATAHVFWELLARAGSLGVTHLDDLLRLPTARGAPHYEKIRMTDGLPRAPGVYMFHDQDDVVIYVGKAKNLRSRVRSYFYGDGRKSVANMLRTLTRISHRRCTTEVEAEIAELRLIHANRPRYNRRSRPPKASHWVKLTRERYPRLSLVRTQRDDGSHYLGPFRSRRAAEMVQHAIWDAVPIRRCITRGGRTSAACSFAQLGVALCPCRGAVSDADYATVVSELTAGITTSPEILLEPLADRIRLHAGQRRFEDAASTRDRHRALAMALDRRRNWGALHEAGVLWAADGNGDSVLIEAGRLVASWTHPAPPPLIPVVSSPPVAEQVPPSLSVAEEADILWRWLNRAGVRIIDTTQPMSLPVARVRRIETLAS
jgi:DNA polymerase-3 subunit epsilon